MTTHIVRQGEHLSMIAAAHGYTDLRAIYDHPSNADLKRLRPNPDLLHPGDLVEIPPKQPKEVEATTGRVHTFRVQTLKKMLRLLIRDRIGNLVRSTPFELTIEGQVIEGSTTTSGAIEVPIEAHVSAATLRIMNHTWNLHVGDLNPVDDAADGGVTGAQMRLQNLGFPTGGVDGILGPKTRAAIRAFQRAHRIKPTGALDAATLAKLKQRHGA